MLPYERANRFAVVSWTTASAARATSPQERGEVGDISADQGDLVSPADRRGLAKNTEHRVHGLSCAVSRSGVSDPEDAHDACDPVLAVVAHHSLSQ